MNIGKAIDALIAKKDLSYEDTFELFSSVIKDEETAMNQGAFLAALTAKGATEEEIAAIQKVIYDFDTVKVSVQTDKPIAENSGTGMDAFKTFNISTASSIIASACGVAMARHGSRAITSSCGTVDVAEALGVSVETESSVVAKSIETCGLGLFNGMSANVHPLGLGRILSKINFGTVLNIAASLANPVCPQYGIRGVNDPKMMVPTAEIMHNIGYKKVFVVHGYIGEDEKGIDEISTLGHTVYVEMDENGVLTEGSFYPEDFGVKRGDKETIASLNDPHLEAIRLVHLLSGEQWDSCTDIALLNAAAILYLTGVETSLERAYLRGKASLISGKTEEQLFAWVAAQQTGNAEEAIERLKQMKKEGKVGK